MLRTCRAFWVVMSPTMVRTPLTALMGTRSMPMIRLLIGMVFCATCSQPPAHAVLRWKHIETLATNSETSKGQKSR